jgi:carboxymethylenebutenolidase
MTTTVDLSGSSVPGISRGLVGHLARPAGEGPWPGVVVLFEAFGVDDVGLRHVQRLADAGYLALMPDLYSQGGARRCLVGTFRALFSGQGRAYQDIEAARQWLAASPDCTGKVGTIGFCMGGGFALMTANRGFDASSVNYGAPMPKDLDAALAGACPVVGSYGAKDRGLKGAAAKLEAGLERAGIPHDVKEYPAASHAFLNDAEVGPKLLRPLLRVAGIGPEPASAADAWQRIETFLDRHLSGDHLGPPETT